MLGLDFLAFLIRLAVKPAAIRSGYRQSLRMHP